MNFNESLLTALDSLMANKLRSLLTMLGVIIGVAAVIALMGVGQGFSNFLAEEINSAGTNLIFIYTDSDNSGGRPAISVNDFYALQEPGRVPDVVEFGAAVDSRQEVIRQGANLFVEVRGVTDNFFRINNREELEYGDLIYQSDIDAEARVAVLGPGAAEDLFGAEYPIGQSIRIKGANYQVVGVLEAAESNFGDGDTTVYIPISTAQRRVSTPRTRTGDPALSIIFAVGASEQVNELALEQIATVLREEHDIAYASEDDFVLTSQSDLLETFGAITATFTLILGAIAGISLLVGGIGIMNIMLVSVTERTREIGIRKALGALRRDVLAQFLIESLILSLIGGFIGITLGYALAILIERFGDISADISIGIIALATGFALAVGLIFGIYPAWRASNLRPIEALRYE